MDQEGRQTRVRFRFLREPHGRPERPGRPGSRGHRLPHPRAAPGKRGVARGRVPPDRASRSPSCPTSRPGAAQPQLGTMIRLSKALDSAFGRLVSGTGTKLYSITRHHERRTVARSTSAGRPQARLCIQEPGPGREGSAHGSADGAADRNGRAGGFRPRRGGVRLRARGHGGLRDRKRPLRARARATAPITSPRRPISSPPRQGRRPFWLCCTLPPENGVVETCVTIRPAGDPGPDPGSAGRPRRVVVDFFSPIVPCASPCKSLAREPAPARYSPTPHRAMQMPPESAAGLKTLLTGHRMERLFIPIRQEALPMRRLVPVFGGAAAPGIGRRPRRHGGHRPASCSWTSRSSRSRTGCSFSWSSARPRRRWPCAWRSARARPSRSAARPASPTCSST